MDIPAISALLNGAMTLAALDEEFYLTTPLNGGALEIHSDRSVWFRRWAPNHGLSEERQVTVMPDVPIYEQAAFIRVLIPVINIQSENYTDDYKIAEACRKAQHAGNEINDGTARAIASQFDDDMPDVREFVSTGAITTDDLWWNMFGSLYPVLSHDDQLAADMVGTYIVKRRLAGQTGPVTNWSRKWVDRP
jgi:hypothetical protein